MANKSRAVVTSPDPDNRCASRRGRQGGALRTPTLGEWRAREWQHGVGAEALASRHRHGAVCPGVAVVVGSGRAGAAHRQHRTADLGAQPGMGLLQTSAAADLAALARRAGAGLERLGYLPPRGALHPGGVCADVEHAARHAWRGLCRDRRAGRPVPEFGRHGQGLRGGTRLRQDRAAGGLRQADPQRPDAGPGIRHARHHDGGRAQDPRDREGQPGQARRCSRPARLGLRR